MGSRDRPHGLQMYRLYAGKQGGQALHHNLNMQEWHSAHLQYSHDKSYPIPVLLRRV